MEPVFGDDTRRWKSVAGLTESVEEIQLDSIVLMFECLP